jgi:hypothetical protein
VRRLNSTSHRIQCTLKYYQPAKLNGIEGKL